MYSWFLTYRESRIDALGFAAWTVLDDLVEPCHVRATGCSGTELLPVSKRLS
jgi:hypothetical protein